MNWLRTAILKFRLAPSSFSVAVLIASPWACAHPASAQTEGNPDSGHTVISVTSRLVVLDVVVTDSNGAIVPNLKREDFTILQDGVPKTIRNFDTWTDRTPPSPTPVTDPFGHQNWGADVPLTIFVLDELNTPFDEKNFAVENLRSYLRAQPALLASPAMLVTVNYTGLNTLSPYTRDRDGLLRAINRRPPALPGSISKLELASATFGMLRQIAIASEGFHTHKSLIWLGRGFPALDPIEYDDASNVILKKAIEDTVNLLIEARVTLYQVDPISTDARTQMTDLNAALASGVNFDPGMASNGTTDLLDEKFSVNRFVVATGGQLYYGRNDLDKFIADSEHRTTEFYTLTCVPPASVDEDVYHTISIQMKNPALHAETRQGFYSMQPNPSEPSMRNLGFDLKLASTSAMTYPSVETRVSKVTSSRVPGKVTVSFDVQDSSLRWTPRTTGDESAKITVLLVALDKSRAILSSAASSLNLAVKNSGEVAAGRLEAKEDVVVTPKTCSVRLIVRDSSGRIGTSDVDRATLAAIPGLNVASRCSMQR